MDIDIDTESSKREEIIRLTKEEYGEENVLNMGTFTTEGTRSAIITTCRGLGIDRDISNNISRLVPADGAKVWSLRDCFYGNEEDNKQPVKEFITEVNKYEGLKDALLSIEGVISGRSQHASGVIVFQDGFIKQNAMMKTTKGLSVTQFDADDSEYMGGLKLDYLSINALDRIRAAMELLLEYGKIEWQGSLRKTYNKYFHPDVLEMDDPEMFKMLFDGHVINAFQFETDVGQQALNKLNARTFDEIVAANSLMRLSSEGEQPLDKFIKHKENINLWYEEMKEFGLTKEEIKIMEARSAETYGITDSQEGLMELFMDDNISNLGLLEANAFRKAVAKQDQEELKHQKDIFYAGGFENNARKELLDYVWETQFKPSFGYSFSRPHTAAYTLILMIEMNICFRYGSVFWKTACLSVNAGLIGDSEKGTDYGAIAKAVGDMKGIILNPDINISENGFTPLEKENKILFGLKPIPGLGSDVVDAVIENRPYSSFNDFYEKLVVSKIISEKKAVQLIKAGCFDSFEKDRRQLMIDYVKIITPKREKLTMAQFPVVRYIIDEEKYKKELDLYDFRMGCFGRNKIPMNEELEKEFISKYSKEEIEYSFEKGKLVINEKDFNKFYQKSIDPLKDWINTKEALEEFRKVKMREFWRENCMGSIEAWEMETILFYSDKHELDYMPLDRNFNIVNFNDLPAEPVITGYKTYKNRKYPQFKIDTIAGTVVEKIKSKRLVYILTQDGVVTVRYSKGQYNYYDKKAVGIEGKNKEVLDDSWFKRGSKLILVGFRRGEQFVLRKNGTMYNHTTIKVNGFDNDRLYLQVEKIEA